MTDFKILYIVSNIGPIIDSLHSSFQSHNVGMKGLFYCIREKDEKFEIPDYADYYYTFRKYERGPLFYLSRLKRISKACYKELQNNNYNVLHGHMLFRDGIICREVNKIAGTDYFVSVRNTDMNLWFLWKLPWIRKRGIDAALHAKGVVFLNAPYREEFLKSIPQKHREILRNKSRVIPNGVDPFWQHNLVSRRSIKDKNKIYILSVGRVEDNKNQITVAKAVEILEESGIQIEYTNVGTFVNKELTDELKNKYHVHLIGNMEKESLLNYYRDADIFVMPSHKETFGLVYAEAMTQGLPVVYTKGQGFDGQYKDGEVGYAVDSSNPMAVAEAVKKIIDNYDDISERCLKCATRYNWDLVTASYLEMYMER